MSDGSRGGKGLGQATVAHDSHVCVLDEPFGQHRITVAA